MEYLRGHTTKIEADATSKESIVNFATSLLDSDCRKHPKENENQKIGESPETGFDCSGFVRYVLTKTGIAIPESIRHTSEFFDKFGIFVQIHQPGDLVFFSQKGIVPNHMGIMIDDHRYIHSPGRNNSKVVVAELKTKLIPIKNVNQLYKENPIGFKRPAIQNGRWQNPVL